MSSESVVVIASVSGSEALSPATGRSSAAVPVLGVEDGLPSLTSISRNFNHLVHPAPWKGRESRAIKMRASVGMGNFALKTDAAAVQIFDQPLLFDWSSVSDFQLPTQKSSL